MLVLGNLKQYMTDRKEYRREYYQRNRDKYRELARRRYLEDRERWGGNRERLYGQLYKRTSDKEIADLWARYFDSRKGEILGKISTPTGFVDVVTNNTKRIPSYPSNPLLHTLYDPPITIALGHGRCITPAPAPEINTRFEKTLDPAPRHESKILNPIPKAYELHKRIDINGKVKWVRHRVKRSQSSLGEQ